MWRRRFRRAECAAALGFVCLAGLAPPVRAQYLFGQNKVIYAGRDWQVVSTPRLDVYYYKGEEELAAYLADFAEKTCVEYETWFDHKFKVKIPFVLYASHHDFKQTNVIDALLSDYVGGFTEFMRGRVAIPHTGSMTQLRNVTRHELVHAFMNDKLATLMSDRKRFNLPPPPLWFSEGLAEYLAVGEPDTEARMFVRDLVVNDNLVEYQELWRISGTFLMYKEGESLVGYIGTRFGDRALVKFLENWWMGDGFDSVLWKTLAMTPEDLNRDWKRALKRRYYPAVMENEWPEQAGVALTERPGLNTRPCIVGDSLASDGKLDFVFLSSQAGSIDLVRAQSRSPEPGPHPARHEFETLVRGGRSERFEAFPAFNSGPEVDRGRVAFTVTSGGRDALVLYDLERHREVDRFEFKDIVNISSPTWSPDGQELAFSGLDRSGWPDLYRLRLSDRELTRLTQDLADDRDPDWSHDGRRLAWSSDRAAPEANGVYHIWILDLESGNSTPITGGTHEDTAPVWGPRDESLLFGSDADGHNNIYLYEFADQKLSQVTASLGGIFTPQWLPDGSGFLACVFANTSYNVFQFGIDRRREVPDAVPAVQLASAATQPAASGTDANDWIGKARLTHFPSKDYRAKFGLDFIRTAVAYDPGFTSAAGGQLGFTDMLGNHQLSLYAANSAESLDEFFRHLNLGATYTNLSHRLNYSFGAFHLTSRYDYRSDTYRYERRWGFMAGVAYPLSRYRRVESTMVARVASLDREDSELLGVKSQSMLLSNYTAFVHDNTIWSQTGPVDGTRLNVTLGHTFDLNTSRRGGSSAQIDVRRYVPMPGRTVLAGRVAARGSWGPDVQYFYLGGPFDLRGYRMRSLFARRTLLSNAEIRFPLLDRLLLGLPFSNLEFGGFRGVLFGDAAYVGVPYSGWYGSFGVGFEMWLGPGFVARFDVGRIHDFRSIAPDTFRRFFLGWDY